MSGAGDNDLPESLSQGMIMLKGKSTFLQVDLSQSITKEQESKTLSLGSGLSPTPAASPWPHHYLLSWRTLPNWWIPPPK